MSKKNNDQEKKKQVDEKIKALADKIRAGKDNKKVMKRKDNAGANNKYETLVLPRIEEVLHWCRDGLTDKEIAQRLGVHPSTLITYKHTHPDLAAAMLENKQKADYRVEDSLYKRAMGYEYEEVVKELMPKRDKYGNLLTDEDGAVIQELVVTKVTKKQMAPDTTAQIFWLKNRQPGKWRDRHEQHVTAEVKSVEQFLDEIDKGKKEAEAGKAESSGDYEY